MGSPVFRAEAHGDLEHLCVHHVGYHSQEACGGSRARHQEARWGFVHPHRPVSARGERGPSWGGRLAGPEHRRLESGHFLRQQRSLSLSQRGKGSPVEI